MGQQEELTRALASALSRSGSGSAPLGSALDDWLAAEEMVAEALSMTRGAPEAEPGATALPVSSLPSSAFPVEKVRELAQCFWDHSTRSAMSTLDIWIAAERHVYAIYRAALAGHGELSQFSAEAYWRRIRDQAEWLWHARGRPGQRDMDTWLEAEAEVLAQAAAGAVTVVTPAEESSGSESRRPASPGELAEEECSVEPWYPQVRPENQGAQLPL